MFRLDQKGVSLPLVLAILGLVIANTYYFMDVEKNTKEQNIKRGAEIEDNSEKIRLASFLSDVNVCSSINIPIKPVGSRNSVFGGKTIAEINDPTTGQVIPLKKEGIDFLKLAIQTGPPAKPDYQPLYGRGSLRFLNYKIVVTNPASPNPDISKRYSLLVTYTIMDRADQTRLTNKTKLIRLPLYIVFAAGNPTGIITTCYTEADEGLNTVINAVDASCKGNTARFVTNGLVECQHEQNDKACPNSEVLVGIKLTDDNPSINKQEYVCGHPKNTGLAAGTYCTDTPMRELLTDLQSGDKFVCKTTDSGCASGQMLIMGSSGAPSCITTYCAFNELFKKFDSAGNPTCIPRPKQCPVGQYTKTISKGGDITCEAYTVLNKSCSVGKVAREIDPTAGATASGDTALGCVAITKDKVCAGVTTETTFVQSLTTVVPSCKTF